MLIPYRADLEHDTVPWVTLLVCVLCAFVYWQQTRSELDIATSAERYCKQTEHSRRFALTVEKVTGERSRRACAELLAVVHGSGRAEAVIPILAEHAQPWDTMSASESERYTAAELTRVETAFAATVPPTLTEELVFDPATSSVFNMFTAAIAHGSLDHLIGNLFFFIAFAVLVEAAAGSVIYVLLLLEFAYGTHVAYAVQQMALHESIPTLGLSGVVSGMIGLFAYLAPAMNIRCVLFLGIFWRTFAIPAWLLAAWFVGWDVFNMFHDKGASNVNFIAHVSGAVVGYLTGVAFFQSTRERISAAMNGYVRSKARAAPARRSGMPVSRPATRPRR